MNPASRDRSAMLSTLLVALVVVLFGMLGASRLSAQEETSPALTGPRIELVEAVSRTLRNSAVLADAEQSVLERGGVAMETEGLFDPLLFFDNQFLLRQLELLSGQFGAEMRRRVPVEFAAGCDPPLCDPNDPESIGELNKAADALARGQFSAGSLLFQPCNDIDSLLVFTLQGGRDVTICVDAAGNPRAIEIVSNFDGDLITSEQLSTLVRIQTILDILQLDLGVGLDEQINDLINSLQDEIREIVRQLRTTAAVFRIGRANLGTIPEVEEFLELTAELGNRWQFRNGLALTGTLSLLGREDNYVDKPRIVAFGDAAPPNTFSLTAGVTLDIPLAAGRGRIATYGTSIAAQTAVRAQEEVYQHTAAGEALRTIVSYWVLAAAEERARVLEGSLGVQSRILDATRTLIEADELAAASIDRTEARHAQVAGQVASARQEVTRARADLSDAMGEVPAGLAAMPLAAEPLPAGTGETYDPGAWVDRALQQRDDVAAAKLATEATQTLENVARTDLRRRVDLSLNTSFNAFAESFDDRLYEPDAYWDAASGLISGPSYGFVLRFDLPFQNRAAKGRLAQARANTSTSRINEVDLARQVRFQINDLARALERKRLQLVQLEESARQSDLALESSNALYDAGELTLIDLLSTEEQATSARLALVDLRAEIAILEAQLRFEAGELLEPEAPDANYRALRLRPRTS